MTDVLYGIFDDVENAERAVSALKDHGVDGNEISIVRRSDGAGLPRLENEASEGITVTSAADVAAGAAKGGAAGLALGVLAGAVALTIPGIGPILAAGPIAGALGAVLATTAAGVLSGGVVGYFVDQGVPEEAATRYHEAITRGDILVTVRSAHVRNADALMILEKYGATRTERHTVGAPAVSAAEPPVIDREDDLENRAVIPTTPSAATTVTTTATTVTPAPPTTGSA
jgi:hypothetical protein